MNKKNKNEGVDIDIEQAANYPKKNKTQENIKEKIIIKTSIDNIIENLQNLSQEDLLKINKLIDKKTSFEDLKFKIKDIDDVRTAYNRIKKNKDTTHVSFNMLNSVNDLTIHLAKKWGVNKSQVANMSILCIYNMLEE